MYTKEYIMGTRLFANLPEEIKKADFVYIMNKIIKHL